jgi:hypothetical protein
MIRSARASREGRATTGARNDASTAATEAVGTAFVCGLVNGARGDAGVATIGPIPRTLRSAHVPWEIDSKGN